MRLKVIQKSGMISHKMCHLGIASFIESHFVARHMCRTTQTFSSKIEQTEKTNFESSHWEVLLDIIVPKFYEYKDS